MAVLRIRLQNCWKNCFKAGQMLYWCFRRNHRTSLALPGGFPLGTRAPCPFKQFFHKPKISSRLHGGKIALSLSFLCSKWVASVKPATEVPSSYCVLTCKCLPQGLLILSFLLTYSVQSGYVVRVGAVGRKGLQMLARKVPCLRRASTAAWGWQRQLSQEFSSGWAEGMIGTARLWFICHWCSSFMAGE